jgi:fused signal recognition particle receptor
MFKDNCGIDEIILTKLDGTAKGGMALAIALRLSIPITHVGLGEKMEDLRPFNGEDFAKALVGADGLGPARTRGGSGGVAPRPESDEAL